MITTCIKKPKPKKPTNKKQTQKAPVKLKQAEQQMFFRSPFSTEKQVNS